MTKRILLAALLGGVALFLWEFVAHMISGLGEAGVRGLDNEAAVMDALKQNIKAPGFYLFPAPKYKPGMTAEERRQCMREMQVKWSTGLSGMMVVHPEGQPSLTGGQLMTQFGADLVVMLLAAWLLAQVGAAAGYGGRLLFVTSLAVVPILRSELPYWNWYGFPGVYFASQATIDVLGFFLAGLILAWLVKPAPR